MPGCCAAARRWICENGSTALLRVEHAEAPLGLEVLVERGPVPVELDVAGERGDAVAVASVERVLGRPEVGHRLAALVDVVELGPHERAEDPAAAVRRQDADERHASCPDEAARHARLEGEDAGAADHGAVVERRVHALRRDQQADRVREVGARRPSEVVEDRLDRSGKLVGRRRADLDRQPIRSSGA